MTDRPEDERPDRELVDSLFHRSRTTYLLVALVMLIILYPYWEQWRFGEVLNGIFVVSIALAGVYAVSGSRTAAGLALVIAFPGLSIVGYRILYPEQAQWALIVVPILASLFFAVVFTHVFGHVLKHGTMTADKLHGAVCCYILLGFGWSRLYLLVERLSPGSLVVSETHNTGGVPSANDLLYMSITTLTTTGYGDVIAVTSAAQSLAILEQIVGVFFVAILIARLAGVYPPEPGQRSAAARGARAPRSKVKR
jgi:hypothetical protein